MSWLLCQGMWQSQGNARGDLFPKPGFFDSDLLWVRDSCLILRAVVLALPVPEPNGYGDLGLAWDSAWIVFSLKLMSPKAGRWLGGDGLTLPVPLGVASRDWTLQNLSSWAWFYQGFSGLSGFHEMVGRGRCVLLSERGFWTLVPCLRICLWKMSFTEKTVFCLLCPPNQCVQNLAPKKP